MAQLPVYRRINLLQPERIGKETLAADGEKLRGMFGRIGIDIGHFVPVELLAERIEGALKGLLPQQAAHLPRQRRRAVRLTAQHVELVGQLVDHQIKAVPVAILLQFAPGQHQRPLRPGFASVLLFKLAHQPELILYFLTPGHGLGNDDDFVKAAIPVKAKVQDGQRRLQRQHRLLTAAELDPDQAQGLALEQLLPQADKHCLLGVAEPLQDGHSRQRLTPQRQLILTHGRLRATTQPFEPSQHAYSFF